MWYKPNVKNNNALRDRAVKRITAFMNKIWNGEITSVSYKHETILSIMDEMMESAKALSVVDAKGTENVYPVYYRLNVLIDILEKNVSDYAVWMISDIVNDIVYYLGRWKEELTVKLNFGQLPVSMMWRHKLRTVTNSLDKVYNELVDFKLSVLSSNADLEQRVETYKKEKKKLEEQLINTDDELKMGELCRLIDQTSNLSIGCAGRINDNRSIYLEVDKSCSEVRAVLKKLVFEQKSLETAQEVLDKCIALNKKCKQIML